MNAKNTVKKKKKRNYFFYNFVRFTAGPLVLWARPKVLNIGNTRPKDVKKGAIIACNHISMYDIIFCYSVFWRRIMHSVASSDLFEKKLAAFFFKSVHCIPVDRKNFSMNCFHEVKEVLQEEKLVLIFPEGRVNNQQEDMLPFKSGVILMAHSTGKPIIPMYLAKREKWYHRWWGVLGDPIDVREICGPIPSLEKINQVSALLQEKEAELKEFYERSRKK